MSIQMLPDWLSSTLASDATAGRGALPVWISALKPETRAVGPVCVALTSHNDNLSIREAIKTPHAPGTVLVVAGGFNSQTATIGDLLALELRNNGIIGLITDGLVRDSAEIRRMSGFSVWCRGVTPMASQKVGPAVVGGTISLGGVIIRDGDIVIADDDGVVIWPHGEIAELLAAADAKRLQDDARLTQLQAQSPR